MNPNEPLGKNPDERFFRAPEYEDSFWITLVNFPEEAERAFGGTKGLIGCGFDPIESTIPSEEMRGEWPAKPEKR